MQYIEIIEFNIRDKTAQAISLDELNIADAPSHCLYWIHCYLNNHPTLMKLADKLSLPDELIELCESNDSTPKLIESNDHLTFNIQCLNDESNQHSDVDNFENLILHLTERFCFTASTTSIPTLQEFINGYQHGLKYAETSCFILFLMIDAAINQYSQSLLRIEVIADNFDIAIRENHDNIYSDVMARKKYVMKIKRHMAIIRDILMRISGRKIAVVSEQCRLSLGDLFNHSQMMISEADAIRDDINGMLDQIDNMLMQKMNSTMKVLTGFASIFLPLTLIAGIYGMNFQHMPELSWQYGYWYALLLMLFSGIFLFVIFKFNKWL